MKRMMPWIIALAAAHALTSNGAAQVNADELNSVWARDTVPNRVGGIAGVGYFENFESGYEYGCQPGLNCELEVINHPDSNFGDYSMLNRATGSGFGLQDYRSPVFALQAGGIYADIIINDNSSLFQIITVNNTTGSFNTRLNFEANGTIRALQISGAPPCSTGVFANTSSTWTPGVKMRIGVEVLEGNILRVYKEGVQIFQGHDISQFCNAGNPAVGISQIRNLNSNIGNTATFVIDNISSSAVFNPCDIPLSINCPADVHPPGGDGVVNIDDLVQGVIQTWGQTQNPPGTGPRPLGDCAPGPNGDCEVDVDDLLAIISGWGQCPAIVGACCIQGVCITLQPEVCTGAPWFGTYHGDFLHCSQVTCPLPPLGDMCANPVTAVEGVNNWSNANANADGPAPPAPCFPNGGHLRGDVWFRFTANGPGHYIFDTVGTAAPFTDTFLQVYNSWNCDPPGPMIACNDDINFASNNWLSRVNITLSGGQQVLIRCASNGASPANNSGAAVLNIQYMPFDNDHCTDATLIPLDTPVQGSLQGATPEATANCLPGAPQPVLGSGRWYKVIGDGNILTASTCASPVEFSWDGRLSVYCGGQTCPNMWCAAASATFDCGPTGEQGTGLQERVSWCSTNGWHYYILVSGDPAPVAPEGNYTLTVSSGAACCGAIPACSEPSNQICQMAMPVVSGTTSFMAWQNCTDGTPNPPGLCNDNGGTQTVNDIWYRYTAVCTGMLTVSTCSNLGGACNFDTDLVLYPGNATCPPPAASIIACNDNDPNNPCGTAWPFASTLMAGVTAGQTYILRVGGWNNPVTDLGTGILSVSCAPAQTEAAPPIDRRKETDVSLDDEPSGAAPSPRR